MTSEDIILSSDFSHQNLYFIFITLPSVLDLDTATTPGDDETGKIARNNNVEGAEILKYEVKSATAYLKSNKTERLDGIEIEMLLALDNFNVEKITEIIKENK